MIRDDAMMRGHMKGLQIVGLVTLTVCGLAFVLNAIPSGEQPSSLLATRWVQTQRGQQQLSQDMESWAGLNAQGQPIVVQQNAPNTGWNGYMPKRVRSLARLPIQVLDNQAPESYMGLNTGGKPIIIQSNSPNTGWNGYQPEFARLLSPADLRSLAEQQEKESWMIYGPDGNIMINQQNAGNFVEGPATPYTGR